MLLWLLPKRLRSSWAILAITSFGILAAVTLMAVGAVYSQVLAEAGLVHTVALIEPTVMDAQVIVRNRPLSPADYDKLRPKVEQLTDTRLGYMMRERGRSGLLQLDFPIVFERPEDLSQVTGSTHFGYVFFLTEFDERAHTSLKGDWPRMRPLPEGKGLELEVVVGEGTARSLALRVGSRMFLVPFRDDLEDLITLNVVGIASPVDPEAEYWLNAAVAYFELQEGEDFSFIPLYLPEEIFFDALATRYPFLLGDFGWRLFLDPTTLDVSMVQPTKDAIVGLDTDVHKEFPRSLVISGLENKLTEFQGRLNHARVPIFIFISMVVLVVLYFLGLATGLLARTQRDEASLLRSRGASVVQVSALLAAVETVLVVVMVVVGPFLAVLVVRHLLLGTINPAGDAGSPPVALSPDVFIVAVIGGLLSLVILTLSGVGLARLGIIEFLTMRARPPTIPLLQRYYIDLLVVAAAAFVWWQIHDRGGFTERDLLGVDLEVDPLLLLGPVLALLAAALILLRLLPLLIRAVTRAALAAVPAWAALSLSQVARDPMPHSSLAVMLMMAAALGVFGASFQTTLSENERDRIRYGLGGDLVISGSFFSTTLQANLAKTPGVEAITPIIRRPATFSNSLPGEFATLLAIDQDTLADTGWFRGDFSRKGLSELLKPLQRHTERPQGPILPKEAETVGIWVKVKDLTESQGQTRFQLSTELWMRLADASGRHATLFFGALVYPVTEEEWRLYEAPIPEGGARGYELPFSVVSVFLSGDPSGRMPAGEIHLDDLTVKGSSTQPIDLDQAAWVVMPNAEPQPDTIQSVRSAARTGRSGLKYTWRDADRGYARGILIPPGPFPIPAIGGPGLRPGQEVVVQSAGHLLPLVITDVVQYFPTLDPNTDRFALVPLDGYREYIERARAEFLSPPRELWLSLSPGSDRKETLDAILDVLPFPVLVGDSERSVGQAQRNPLAGGGWNGLTLLGISAVATAVLLALVTYAIVSVRSSRMDLTIVKVLGLTERQVLLGLTLERILVAIIGIAVGSGVGIWLAHSVLSTLDRTPRGLPLVPPIVVSIEAWLVSLMLVELLVALALATLVAAHSARRLKTPDILRVGQ